jgi:hypothetical protein
MDVKTKMSILVPFDACAKVSDSKKHANFEVKRSWRHLWNAEQQSSIGNSSFLSI